MLLATFLPGCATSGQRIESGLSQIRDAGYRTETLQTSSFNLLAAFPPSSQAGPVLNIVIEGDGYAWATRRSPSDDPTPKNPVGFYLARQNQGIYLARPCQYVSSSACSAEYWTNKRFGPAVITAYQEALDALSTRYNHAPFHITGYSGGAYIALILAATRPDVKTVTSVAGLLDPESWTQHHKISGLEVQYDAAYLREHSKNTQFVHVCGLEDDVIPCSITEDFITGAQKQGFLNHQQMRLPADHQEIWKRTSIDPFMQR